MPGKINQIKNIVRSTKLIFIDGLPGLGKSTTSEWLAGRLRSAGLPVNLYLETQPAHPLNVGADLHPAGNIAGEAYFQRYTPASYISESLDRWQAFIHSASLVEAINILDSYPFQNSVRILLQMNADTPIIQTYADQVEALVQPLQPVLIYFNHPDLDHVVRQFNAISTQRGKAWTDYVINLVMHCPYALTRHLEGYQGVLQFLVDYRQLLDGLLPRSRLPRLVLENCSQGWSDCYRQIEAFLGLSD